MSYAIHPFAVSFSQIDTVLGSGKKRIVKKLNQLFQDEYEEIDELDDELPPMNGIISDLVMGKERNPDCGFKYGYALKFLCEYFGDMLTNHAWSAIRWEWGSEVDRFLAEHKIDEHLFRVETHLLARGTIFDLPQIADFPAIGWLGNLEMQQVFESLTAPVSVAADVEIRASLEEIQSWISQCRQTGKDLICFYH